MNTLRHDVRRGAAAALCVTACLFLLNWRVVPAAEVVPAAAFCLCLYFLFFTLGTDSVSLFIRERIDGRPWRCLALPAALSGFLCAYALVVNGDPRHWAGVAPTTAFLYLAAAPAVALLPALLFSRHARGGEKAGGGWDFLLFAAAAGLAGWFRFPFDRLPQAGASFQTASGLTMLLVLVYVTVELRRLPFVGFTLSFSWQDLLLTLGCWLVMLALFVGMLYPTGLIEYVGHKDWSFRGFQDGFGYFLSHLLRVGVFEEFVFRGIFQNLLAQRAALLSDKARARLWSFSAVALAAAAFAATFLAKDAGNRWLPPLVVLLLFAAAQFVERRFNVRKGEYVVLAMISAVFGVVHYRFGVTFMALACLAGWFDGFVYTKTKNVYLAALIHALLNCSAMFLGFRKNF